MYPFKYLTSINYHYITYIHYWIGNFQGNRPTAQIRLKRNSPVQSELDWEGENHVNWSYLFHCTYYPILSILYKNNNQREYIYGSHFGRYEAVTFSGKYGYSTDILACIPPFEWDFSFNIFRYIWDWKTNKPSTTTQGKKIILLNPQKNAHNCEAFFILWFLTCKYQTKYYAKEYLIINNFSLWLRFVYYWIGNSGRLSNRSHGSKELSSIKSHSPHYMQKTCK